LSQLSSVGGDNCNEFGFPLGRDDAIPGVAAGPGGYRRHVTGGGEELRAVVERLYTVFEPYKLKSPTEVCWCCHSPEEERVVHQAPLHRLSPDALEGFASDSLMTWGDLEDFKHFLPRLFEILAFDRFRDGFVSMETLVGALSRGGWDDWPVSEQEAVRSFLLTFWDDHLHAWPSYDDIDTVLTSIAQAENDLTPYLEGWEAASGRAPVLHFAEFLLHNISRVALGKRLRNAFFDNRPDQEAQVRTWLLGAGARFSDRIEEVFLAETDDSALELLAAALDVLPRRR
jgi:hypothetical protein